MASSKVCCFLLILATAFASNDTNAVVDESAVSNEQQQQSRNGRNYDNLFPFLEDDDVGVQEPPVYSDSATGDADSLPESDRYPTYNNYKGYPESDQGYWLPHSKIYPYWKPNQDAGRPQNRKPTADQFQVLTLAMNAMRNLQSSKEKEEEGILSKIISDPKSVLVASLLPLSIMLASFIPLIFNYWMTGASPSTVLSTIAAGATSRSLNETNHMDQLLENIVKFGARALEDDGCFQKIICEAAESYIGTKNVQNVAKVVKHFVDKDQLKTFGVKELLHTFEEGSCKDVCDKKGHPNSSVSKN